MRERIDVPDQEVTRCLSETFFLSSKRRPRSGSDHSKLVGGLFQKLLQRGLTPLPTIEVEREAIKNNGLGDWVEELPSSSPEIAFELKRSYRADLQAPHVLQVLTERGAFKLYGEFDQNAGREISLFDSDAEAQFLQKWIPEVFGPTAAHWFVPCLSGLHPHPLGLEWAQTGYRGARHGCSRPRRSPIPAFATRVPATFPR